MKKHIIIGWVLLAVASTLGFIIQDEIFGFAFAVVSPVSEKIFSETFACGRFQKARGDDLIGINILNRQGDCCAF